jgi:hypothetical protein
MDSVCSFEMQATTYQTTRYRDADDDSMNLHRYDDVKSYIRVGNIRSMFRLSKYFPREFMYLYT